MMRIRSNVVGEADSAPQQERFKILEGRRILFKNPVVCWPLPGCDQVGDEIFGALNGEFKGELARDIDVIAAEEVEPVT